MANVYLTGEDSHLKIIPIKRKSTANVKRGISDERVTEEIIGHVISNSQSNYIDDGGIPVFLSYLFH